MFLFKSIIINNSTKLCLNKQIRVYSRWSARTPKKIYLPDEEGVIDKLAEDELMNYPTKISFNKEKIEKTPKIIKNNEILTIRKAKKKKEIQTTDMMETLIDSEGKLIFTKMNDNDTRISKILSNLKSENSLKRENLIILEGKRLIKDALKSGCKLQHLLFSRKSDVEELKDDLPKIGANLYKMPYRELQLWSDLTTNPGIMGLFVKPSIQITNYDIPVNVICDNVREPGNLGAILRTCAGVGCKKVIITKGCCDLWNGKVIRSAMGAHFKVNIEKLDWNNIKDNLKETNWFIADNNLITLPENSTTQEITTPIVSYDSINYSNSNEITLIIGGETEGVSQDAYEIVQSLGGLRLNIPLGNNIESLNSGTALGVLIFEIRRQIKLN